jgi:hypothetical protein
MVHFGHLCLRILASRKFFIFTVALLVIEALWIALSFSYPLLWDEYYHFGLIQFYGHHLSPIIANQPTDLDMYGNVARSPKYFYHYLLSFPYRLIALCTANEAAQIIALRVVNIGIFASALVVFRKAMLLVAPSRALVHFALFVLVMLPFSPLLAAHINYDTLQFLLAGMVLYWALRFIRAKQFEIKWAFLIIGFGSIAAVVKYTFLPVLVAIGAYLVGYAFWKYRRKTLSLAWKSWKQLPRWTAISLVALVVIAVGLSVERFGVNMVKYHRVDPICSQVISVERCMNFSPFKQEYALNQSQGKGADIPANISGPIGFTYLYWIHDLYVQYFTTGTQLAYEVFVVPPALKIPFMTIFAAAIIGSLCFLIASPRLLRRADVQLILLSSVLLAASLWVVDYGKYVHTGAPLAIQGRYLLPLLPMIILLGVMSIDMVLPWKRVKAALGAVVMLGLIWGGGILPHIAQSDATWYWNNHIIITTNDAIRRVVSPVLF